MAASFHAIADERSKLRVRLGVRQPGSTSDAVLVAATARAEVENEAARDVSEKTASPPMHRVSFLVEEDEYRDFCENAAAYGLSPSEVARRYCLGGITIATLIWGAVRGGGTVGAWVKVSSGRPNLAQLALPNFSEKGRVGLL